VLASAGLAALITFVFTWLFRMKPEPKQTRPEV
jgi:hypothetical protein